MKFFVTGGSGFIGSNFVDYVLEDKVNRVVNYSRHTYAMNPKVMDHLQDEERYKFVAGDLKNEIFLFRTLQKTNPDVVVHFAASTHVDRSFVYPREFFRNNAYGTFSLLETLRNLNQNIKLLYVSTDEVFGDVPTGFCREKDFLAPRNPYSASKAAAEMLVNAYHHSYSIPTVVARMMNNFGPRQHPEKLISKIITRCLTDTSFTLFKGGSTRGWTYVKDACEAIHKILVEGKNGEIYHIPPSTYKTVPEVTNAILNIMNKQNLFLGFKGQRLKDDERYALEGSKMTYELNWTPKTTFEDGMKQTIAWFRENPWFWKDVYAP